MIKDFVAIKDEWSEPDPDAVEVPLADGDVTEGVVRRGATVRRPTGRHSPLVHAVLAHLDRVGFAGAPRFLGIDAQGREVLTFVEGEVAGRPWPAWVADEARALSVARLARRLDDAMQSFGLPAELLGDAGGTHPDPVEAPARVGPPQTFVAHRDVTPENVVFRDGEAFALIDFDLAQASNRVEVMANLLLWWAPLVPPADRDPAVRDLDAFARTRLILDAYGLDDENRAHLVPVLRNAADRSWHLMRARAETDGGGWRRMWEAGVGDQIRRRVAWLAEQEDRLTAAVRAGDSRPG